MINIPNTLTIFRIALIPLIAAGLLIGALWVALALYVVACITDYLDGYLARRRNQFTRLGVILDPIADKFLIITVIMALIMIDHIGKVTFIAAWIIVVREILVSGLREYLSMVKICVPVSRMAKMKTAIQMISLGFLIVSGGVFAVIGSVGLWLSAIMTLMTGYEYWRSGLSHIIADDRDNMVE